MDSTLEILAQSYMGIPYKWGGNNPIEGFDCSGLVCEILRAMGKIDKTDYSAAALYDMTKKKQTEKYARGCLAFYGKNLSSISHVAILLSPDTILEAGGGNSECTNIDIAAMRGACVRLRPLKYRKDFLAVTSI
jgi:cell wall-associated NlpC family hydrolase